MHVCNHCHAQNPSGLSQCQRCGVTMAGTELSTQPTSGAYHGQVQQDPMIGRWILDQYLVRARIGEGGMGAVYLAEQPSVGRNAVIKIMHPWLSTDAKIAARFDTEARAAARLQNPHIVSIYNYGRLPDDTLFIAMEYLEGRTIAELMRAEGRLDPHRAVGIATQVCEALQEAHRRGVVHRDLTPNNLMLVARRGGPDFVKVLDFGVAKLGGAEATAGRGAVGTPGYMAPEQLRDEPVDGRADIYALAHILYEMLTGRAAFEASSPAALLNKHLNEMPRPMMAAAPGIDINPGLEACVMRGLAKHPYQRPQDADTFAEELWTTMMGTRMFAAPSDARAHAAVTRSGVSTGVLALSITTAVVLVASSVTAGYLLIARGPSEGPELAVAPRPTGTPGLAPPSPAKQALMLHPVADLEAELERVTLLSGLPRNSIDLSIAEYRRAATDPPPGADPETYRKSLLAGLILQWRAAQSETLTTDRDIDELEAVFLMMRSPFDVKTRQRMLVELKKATAKEPDPERAVKRKLLEWIATFGDAPDDEAPLLIGE